MAPFTRKNVPEHLIGSPLVCVAVSETCGFIISPVFEYPAQFDEMQYQLIECFDELSNSEKPNIDDIIDPATMQANIDAIDIVDPADRRQAIWRAQLNPFELAAVDSVFDLIDATPAPHGFVSVSVKGPYGVTFYVSVPAEL